MPFVKYLYNLFLAQESAMMSEFINVVLPVLSITVLMFSLRSFVQDSYPSNMKKQ